MKNEGRDSNISKIIKRYPFNGSSNYLRDNFFIIGYNIQILHKLLIEDNEDNFSKNIIIIGKKQEVEKKINHQLVSNHLIKEEPIILNKITSNFTKDCLDFNIIKENALSK